MFDHLLESSHRDDSNKWSIIRFGEEITQVEPIEVNLHILSGALPLSCGTNVICLLSPLLQFLMYLNAFKIGENIVLDPDDTPSNSAFH